MSRGVVACFTPPPKAQPYSERRLACAV
jgi:hypothetical protein